MPAIGYPQKSQTSGVADSDLTHLVREEPDSVNRVRSTGHFASVARDFLTSWKWLSRFLVFSDIIVATLALWGGFILSPAYGPLDLDFGRPPTFRGMVLIYVSCYVFFSFLWGLYGSLVMARPLACVFPALFAGCCTASVVLGVQYVVSFVLTGRWIMGISLSLTVGPTIATRVLMARLRRGITKRIAFVGPDTLSSLEVTSNLSTESKNISVVRILDASKALFSRQPKDLGVVNQFCLDNEIDLVVVQESCPPETIANIMQIVRNGILVTGLVAFYEHNFRRVPCELIGSQWLLQANHNVHSPVARTLKRAIDLACASAGLLLTMPAWPLVALLIKATSTGPVFYRQDRVGLDGQVFSMVKFRTMCADAECQGAPQWAKFNDNRVTGVGKILRKTRFDEIPQFLNVLWGEMSFVGPRPERPEFVESFRRAIPYYDIRHQVKPGITGWAQIMYAYAASEHETRTKLSYDLYYVKNGTLLFDLEIALRTMRALMNGSR